MNPQVQNYLRTKVLTATPEQLQLMLYDGAIRFAEQGRLALHQRNFEQSYSLLARVQKIILEMACTLKPQVAPDLCGQLSALYNYAYRKLVEANVEHRADALDEVISLLKYQRETWALLMQQLGQQKATAAAAALDLPPPDERMEASLSMQG